MREIKYRRRLNQRGKRLVMFMVVLAMFVSIFVGVTANTYAKDEKREHKYYTSVQVSYGDTLSSIVDTYYTDTYETKDDLMKEIVKLNHIDEDCITAGCYIIVPYYALEPME